MMLPYQAHQYMKNIVDKASIAIWIASMGCAACEQWMAAIYLLGLAWTVSESVKRPGQ